MMCSRTLIFFDEVNFMKEEETQDPAAEEVKPQSKLPLILAMFGFLLLGAGLGAGGMKFFGPQPKVIDPSKEGELLDTTKTYQYIKTPVITVNLRSVAGKGAYLMMVGILEVDTPEDAKKIEEIMPRIIDQFQIFLRGFEESELRGQPGLARIRQELLLRVQQVTGDTKVHDLLIEKFVTQPYAAS